MAELKIKQLLTPMNRTVKNDTNRIKYIVIHYVGALGGAEANCKYYAEASRGASAHYFVGHDGEVFQSVLDGDIAWHCGAKSYKHPECRNTNSIGIELCVRKQNTASLGAEDGDWYFESATVKAAVKLTKTLMSKFNVKADHVLRHFDVTGKMCPNPYVKNEQEWMVFKALLEAPADKEEPKEEIQEDKTPITNNDQSTDYQITTTCDALNIRSGAGTGFPVVGAIKEPEWKKNQYTITEEQNGWGRLKSEAGWISLKYTKKSSTTQVKEKEAETPYKVKTTCNELNIRVGAGTGFPVVGSIKESEEEKNQYTITEEQNGWGRLKSGAGWVKLGYTIKV